MKIKLFLEPGPLIHPHADVLADLASQLMEIRLDRVLDTAEQVVDHCTLVRAATTAGWTEDVIAEFNTAQTVADLARGAIRMRQAFMRLPKHVRKPPKKAS